MANSCLTDDVVWEIVLYVAITIDQHVFHSGKKNPSYQGTHVELNPNTLRLLRGWNDAWREVEFLQCSSNNDHWHKSKSVWKP